MKDAIHKATAFSFDEDREVIERQWASMALSPGALMVGIQEDKAPNLARRIVPRLSGAPVATLWVFGGAYILTHQPA